MLEFVGIEVGTGDPLGCALCAPHAAPVYHATADVVARIREVAAAWEGRPGPNIVLGGPEPFDHPELPTIIAACVEAGVERIALETDGAALSVPANASGVLGAGVRHLWVRVLDADPERGDRLGGRPGRTRHAAAGVRAYAEAAESAGAPVALTAVVPVCEHNLFTLPETMLLLSAGGYHASRLVTAGVLPANAGPVIAATCDTGMVNHLWVETDGVLPLPQTHRLHAVASAVRDE